MRTISDIFFGSKGIRGEIGIEVEIEGHNLPTDNFQKWRVEDDGSLRGAMAREYVLNRPCKRDESLGMLSNLANRLHENDSEIVPSYRTGVHVHVNVRKMTFNQVFCYIFTYLMLEDVLMAYCGTSRVGNLFCLRVRDAEESFKYIGQAIEQNDLGILHTDRLRYSSLNLKAIKSYGSLEFRGMSFTGDFQSIQTWIELLLCVKDYSLTMSNPKELIEILSKKGGQVFAEEVFGDLIQILPKVDWNKKLLSSVRLIQRLVYLSDWEEEKEKVYITVKSGLKPIKKQKRKDVEMEFVEVNEGLGEILRGNNPVDHPVIDWQ